MVAGVEGVGGDLPFIPEKCEHYFVMFPACQTGSDTI